MPTSLTNRLSHLLFLGLIVALAPARAQGAPPKSPHARVTLLADRAAASPTGTLELGLLFDLDPDWHIYWKNPGDSGQAPKVTWKVPAGFAVSTLDWPVPQRIASGPLMNYGYGHQALFRATLHALPGEAEASKTLDVAANVRFLICREDCIPGEADVALSLPVVPAGADAPPSPSAPLFAQAQAAAPSSLGPVQVSDQGTHVALAFTRPEGVPAGTAFVLVPETPLVIANAVPQAQEDSGDTVRVLAEKSDPATPVLALSGLLLAETTPARVYAFEGQLIPSGAAPAAKPVKIGSSVPAQPPREEEGGTTLWVALGLAFLGGMLLNLMPCVFPVLSLKILGFVSHAHDPKEARRHGWAYTAGVFASFWALALVLVVVRAGSHKLGWGFQLQSPAFVALLAGLMVLVGLNLLGTFEVGLSLTRLGQTGGRKGGLAGSFNTGILATAVATPCTAPFMGTALGFALTRPAFESFAVFTALAGGMALPYVWLSHAPGVLKRLPRPGKWMELLRQLLAFPILATVIWLLAVFNQLTGPLAVFELLGALLVLGLAGWIYGAFQRSSGRPPLAMALAVLTLLAGGWLGVRAADSPAPSSAGTTLADEFWQPWSPQKVAELRQQGRAVFVNFTAAWCISCKANELLVFSTPEVRQAFAAHDVVALKADWTNRDEVIAQELETHGRAGVPLYLFYPPAKEGTPTTLPSVLTKGLVLDALATATP
ncbi:MAG: thioredoxin family protein [Myxococcales bacterium]|nr:thioredoxin family protein [Myxococcales bacterium]